ncbi:hypothetical protein ANCDUO_11298 [Ancylostoma duodenale]|uniref:Uncharacterized protein n=1 Tax=Ancylostoma duodenale TaxID=51022 RepID=A0A0C2GBT4_9BILA|nr:hypothetical protein ANCDUO_11298 [Ancylostoma duodenale]
METTGTGVECTTGCQEDVPGIAEGKLGMLKRDLRIAARNIRTGHHVGQKEVFARELTRCSLSIAALSELRSSESKTVPIKVPGSALTMPLYFSGSGHREGVGIKLSSRVVATVITFQPISNRIEVLTSCAKFHAGVMCRDICIYDAAKNQM